MTRTLKSLWVVLVSLSLSACGGDEPGRRPTFAVRGRILVNGQPVKDLQVQAVSSAAPDKDHPVVPRGATDDQGRFELFTYKTGDGAPKGEYYLAIQWGGMRDGEGVADRFGGWYAKPQNSPARFKVEGKELDLGEIQLKVGT